MRSKSAPGATASQSVPDTEFVTFRPSSIHGTGAFAKAEIAQGTRILEYAGQKISKEESLRRCEGNNPYIFALDAQKDLDGDVPWNPARYINHSCDPNCEALMEDGRIWVVARRHIRLGDEITFNYGYDLEDYRAYPCRCGSPNCVGYIVAEEFFEHIGAHKGN
jgi:uncharacterized protein